MTSEWPKHFKPQNQVEYELRTRGFVAHDTYWPADFLGTSEWVLIDAPDGNFYAMEKWRARPPYFTENCILVEEGTELQMKANADQLNFDQRFYPHLLDIPWRKKRDNN